MIKRDGQYLHGNEHRTPIFFSCQFFNLPSFAQNSITEVQLEAHPITTTLFFILNFLLTDLL